MDQEASQLAPRLIRSAFALTLCLACVVFYLVYFVFPWFEPIPYPDQLQVTTGRIVQVDEDCDTVSLGAGTGSYQMICWLEISLRGYPEPLTYSYFLPKYAQVKEALRGGDTVELWVFRSHLPESSLPKIWQVAREDGEPVVSYNEIIVSYRSFRRWPVIAVGAVAVTALCFFGLLWAGGTLLKHLRH